MLSALRLQVSYPSGILSNCEGNGASTAVRLGLRLPARRLFASCTAVSSIASESSSELTSTVGSTSLYPYQWALNHRHTNFLSYITCAAAISATCLFCSAVATLLAFRRAAKSMEKLMDVTREEIPNTMIAVRLSGMEISDFTMELTDLGQGITRGVKGDNRAAHLAEENTVSMQEVDPTKTEIRGLTLARSARGIREGIVRGRAILQMFFSLTRFSKMIVNYFKSRTKA